MMEKISFKLEVFEGPLDLLLHLIEKNKVNIYDIPIAEITSQYFEYLECASQMDLELSSEFIVLAAQLLYIKSKMLLPRHCDQEAEENEEDPRQELVERLLEYKKYKNATAFLEEREKKYKKIFYKNPDVIEVSEQSLFLSINDLVDAFYSAVLRKQRENPVQRPYFNNVLNKEEVSVNDKMKDILQIVITKKEIRFIDIFKKMTSKSEIIASFLAVLELIKLNKIIAEQKRPDHIYLRYNERMVI
ncbi:MAG: segregation/condensation protein A [Clostridiaceae bacterium]|nr:segregation/condensation protein A [Clostridiaceae bacterium]